MSRDGDLALLQLPRPDARQLPRDHAVLAVVIYSRAAAERLAVPVEEIARRIAAQHGLKLIA